MKYVTVAELEGMKSQGFWVQPTLEQLDRMAATIRAQADVLQRMRDKFRFSYWQDPAEQHEYLKRIDAVLRGTQE